MNALQVIQSKLNAPKNQTNNFGKYKYRSCEDILAAAKPLLAGTSSTLVLTDAILLVGDRYYVESTARLQDGDVIWSAVGYAREAQSKKGMDESQITGAASSYSRKYALNGLFAIDDLEDHDSLNDQEDETIQEGISAKQIAKIKDFLKSDKCSEPDLLTWAKVERVEDIPADKYNMALAGLAKRVAA